MAVHEYAGSDPWTLYATTTYGYDLADRLVGVEDAHGNRTSISYDALGRLVAYRRDGKLRWVGTDHLGGTVLVADTSFSPLDRMRYTPCGESRDTGSALGTDHLFTSQIRDGSIGLYGAWLIRQCR